MHVGGCGRILQRLPNVLALQVGVFRQDLIERPPGRDQAYHGFHSDAQATNRRLAFKLVWLDGDPVEVHALSLAPILPHERSDRARLHRQVESRLASAPGRPNIRTKANVARVYDYWLGGDHNFQADRDLARTIIALDPNIRRVTAQLFMRSRDEITRLCDGFTLLEPGLVWIPQWRPESPDDVPEDPSKYWALVGVARYDGPPASD